MVGRILNHIRARLAAAPSEMRQTAAVKVAQGATEVSNALFSAATAYSPYTADNAYRAQFQSRSPSRGMER